MEFQPLGQLRHPYTNHLRGHPGVAASIQPNRIGRQPKSSARLRDREDVPTSLAGASPIGSWAFSAVENEATEFVRGDGLAHAGINRSGILLNAPRQSR